jgi:4-amino-4-deoxy-L-arabinose transferase-like glycosyltransferase
VRFEQERRLAASLCARLVTHAPISMIMLTAAVVRTWHLSNNGFGRPYYAAGVRSTLSCPHCFLFNSFDPAGFVSLDKPPIAIWFQVLSAKLLGFRGIAVLLPQVIEGLLAIILTYLLVRRSFGKLAALVAAMLLAVTPAVVAADRSNNMESCLVVILLCATWAAVRAAETGRATLLILSMALLGVGFNVKMGAGLALAPILLVVYTFCSAEHGMVRNLLHSAVACVALVVVSLSWTMLYDLTPVSDRPYVGSTTGNSMLELALLYNGANRFIARVRLDPPTQVAGQDASTDAAPPAGARRQRAHL